MSILLIIVHVIVCVALIMIVLLQTGKGADMGAAFGGGGSQTLFGTSGASTFLSKATTVAAIVFMVTSLGLAYVSSRSTSSSVMRDMKAPVEESAAPQSDASEQPKPEASQPAADQDKQED
ncbi:preprotein translocase subunit SecG [Desulfococcaceae bacterium HSG8]|nr:preprotein translocase subunit SecG [Desulfococcaceae bacterium HSG8]